MEIAAQGILHGVLIWEKLGLSVRAWENQSAGLSFDLEGPDAQSVAMLPPPLSLAASRGLLSWLNCTHFTDPKYADLANFAVCELNKLEWFSTPAKITDTAEEIVRRRGTVTNENLFRGILPGSEVGAYLPQYIIAGSKQLGDDALGAPSPKGPNVGDLKAGLMAHGSITIDQAVRIATPGKDFMTSFPIFLDVQAGADYEPDAEKIFEVDPDNSLLRHVKVNVPHPVEGELNKLADNISIGRVRIQHYSFYKSLLK